MENWGTLVIKGMHARVQWRDSATSDGYHPEVAQVEYVAGRRNNLSRDEAFRQAREIYAVSDNVTCVFVVGDEEIPREPRARRVEAADPFESAGFKVAKA